MRGGRYAPKFGREGNHRSQPPVRPIEDVRATSGNCEIAQQVSVVRTRGALQHVLMTESPPEF